MINKLELKIKSFSCELNSFVRNKNTVACFLSSIFWGILSYIYLFTNNLNIFDNIAMTPWGYGTGTSSGRWFYKSLEILWVKFGGIIMYQYLLDYSLC